MTEENLEEKLKAVEASTISEQFKEFAYLEVLGKKADFRKHMMTTAKPECMDSKKEEARSEMMKIIKDAKEELLKYGITCTYERLEIFATK